MNDTFVVLHCDENDKCFHHINTVDPNIKLTKVNMSDNRLCFLNCLVTIDTDCTFAVTVFGKDTHTDQYLNFESSGGGVDPIPCVSTHRISDPRSGPPSFSPHTSSSAATPTGSVHKSQTVSVVGMSGQLKRCNESWFGSLQCGQFAAGWLAGSILCR